MTETTVEERVVEEGNRTEEGCGKEIASGAAQREREKVIEEKREWQRKGSITRSGRGRKDREWSETPERAGRTSRVVEKKETSGMIEGRAAEVNKMQEGTRRKTTSKILIKTNGNAIEKVMNRMKEKNNGRKENNGRKGELTVLSRMKMVLKLDNSC